MKNVFLILMLFPYLLSAQKYDYMWVIGGYNIPGNEEYGGALINFNANPRATYYNYRGMNMFVCNVSISDTAGNLQFYTNGCDIAGANDTILPNGDNINPGPLHYIDCVQNMRGYASGHPTVCTQNWLIIKGFYWDYGLEQKGLYSFVIV